MTPGREHRSRWIAPALVCALAAGCMLGAPPSVTAARPHCAPRPKALAPSGVAVRRFTMLLRVNKLENVAQYAATEARGGLRERIRDRDVFLVNTRFDGSPAAEWASLVAALRTSFPCNRVIALNGLGSTPGLPGYWQALAGDPRVHALMLDWEPGDWARDSSPSTPPWDYGFKLSRARIAERLGPLARSVAALIGAGARPVGLVPGVYHGWNYGLIAKTIDDSNRAVAPERDGFQAVQSQRLCKAGSRSFGEEVLRIRRQYQVWALNGRAPRKARPKQKANPLSLGFEVSFSDTPDPHAPLPVQSVGPDLAASCTLAGLAHGAGAFLYWAHPDSIRALLERPAICRLRPPSRGERAC